jgi:hypothetical protein
MLSGDRLAMRASRHGICEILDDILVRIATLTRRMPEPAGARSILDIEDQIVAGARRNSHRHLIQSQRMPGLPCDDVIRAGCVAAHAEGSHDLPFFAVESQPAAENDDPTDRLPYERVVRLPKFLRISRERGIRIWTCDNAV